MEKGRVQVEHMPYIELVSGGYAVVVGKTRERTYLLTANQGGFGATQMGLYNPKTRRTVTALVISEDTVRRHTLLCFDVSYVVFGDDNAVTDGDFLDKITPIEFSSRLPGIGEKVIVFVDRQGIETQITEVKNLPGNQLGYKIDAPRERGLEGSPVVLSKDKTFIGFTSRDGICCPASTDFVTSTIPSFEKYLGDNRLGLSDLATDYSKYKEARTATRYNPIELGLTGIHNPVNGGIVITGLPNAVSLDGILTKATYEPGETLIKTWIESDPEFRRDFQKYSVGVITRATFTNIVSGKWEEILFGDHNFEYLLTMISYFADLEQEVRMTVIWTDNNQSITKNYIFKPITVKETYQGMVFQRKNYQRSVHVMDNALPIPYPEGALPRGTMITKTEDFLAAYNHLGGLNFDGYRGYITQGK